MIGIHAPAGRFREALAELPRSARRAERPTGEIVVVPGHDGWVGAALAAVSAGAVALVVADPDFVRAPELRRLAGTGIPIIIERQLLRADLAADAVAARTAASRALLPRVLVAEATASRRRMTVAMRDGVGWLRVLAGEALDLVAADEGLALLASRAGISATLTSVVTLRPAAGRIRVQALGEVITDVELEGVAARLATASAAGRLIAPARFESSERLALRRAVEAVTALTPPADLADLTADTDLVERILAATP